jgi:hypothetical protein
MRLAFGRAVSAANLDATMNQRKEPQGMCIAAVLLSSAVLLNCALHGLVEHA